MTIKDWIPTETTESFFGIDRTVPTQEVLTERYCTSLEVENAKLKEQLAERDVADKYAFAKDGYLIAYNEDGSERWRKPVGEVMGMMLASMKALE